LKIFSKYGSISLYTWLATITTLLVAGVLAQVVTNDLAWDDPYLITDVPSLGNPSQLWTMLTVPFWQNSSYTSAQLVDLWRPLTTLFLWLGAFFWGNSPAGFHMLSLACLAAAATAFARLIAKLTTPMAGPNHKNQVAFAVALLFAIHPLSVEVLCMAANMSDHLTFAFMITQIMLILHYFENPRSKIKLLWIALLGLLACSSKELGVVSAGAPLAAWMLHRSLNATFELKQLKKPLLWTATITPVIFYLALRTVIIKNSGSTLTFSADSDFSPLVAFLGFGQALYHSIIPVPSGAHYYILPTDPIAIGLSTAVFILLLLIVIRGVKNKKTISLELTGVILALLVLVPSFVGIKLFALGYKFPARYFHLSLAGFLIAATPFIAKHWAQKIKLIILLTVALLSLLSFVRINQWQNTISLFAAEIDYHPDSAIDHINLSQALINKGAFTNAKKVLLNFDKLNITKTKPSIAMRNCAMSRIALYLDNDADKATLLIEKALKAFPAKLDFVIQLANIRSFAGHPEQAVIILNKAQKAPWFIGFQKKEIDKHLTFYKKLLNHKTNLPKKQ